MEFLISFLVAFAFFFFIFFINQILLLAEEVLSKHVPIGDVLLLIFYSLPTIVALAFPFAALVGGLMAVGRLSSDNEVIALQASGIPLGTLFVPMLVLGCALSIFSFVVNDYFLPLGTLNFGKLYRELIYSNPELELESFSVKEYQDSVIITGRVEGREIRNIVILDRTEDGKQRIITARRAVLSENSEYQEGVISLSMDDAFGQSTSPQEKGRFEYFTSERMIYNILLKDIALSMRNPGPREMSSIDVYRAIRQKEEQFGRRRSDQEERLRRLRFNLVQKGSAVRDAAMTDREGYRTLLRQTVSLVDQFRNESRKNVNDRSLNIYRLEFHKKFSIPFAALAFVVFAFPVGLFTRRSGRSVGFGIGLFVSILYWGMLIAGQTLGIRSGFPPALSMWLPNAVILGLGLLFFLIRWKR